MENMKKRISSFVSVLVILSMLFGVTATFSGCTADEAYNSSETSAELKVTAVLQEKTSVQEEKTTEKEELFETQQTQTETSAKPEKESTTNKIISTTAKPKAEKTTAKETTEKATKSGTTNASTKAETQNPTVLEDDYSSDTVYITQSGSKYHCAGCRYLKKSSIAISKSKAINQGYSPCSVCNP